MAKAIDPRPKDLSAQRDRLRPVRVDRVVSASGAPAATDTGA
jgi:hypothetical protein